MDIGLSFSCLNVQMRGTASCRPLGSGRRVYKIDGILPSGLRVLNQFIDNETIQKPNQNSNGTIGISMLNGTKRFSPFVPFESQFISPSTWTAGCLLYPL